MRTLARITLWTAAVLLLFLGSPAAGQQVLLDWGPNCFGWETDYSGHMSNPGSELTILGKIDIFYEPLDGLDPDLYEYTFIMEGLVSQGTVVIEGIIFETAYSGGTFRIYQDDTPDFAFGTNPPNGTAPSTFTDGELILEGVLSDFEVVLIDTGMPPGASGNATTNWQFTGGSLYALVDGCYGAMLGAWTDDPDMVPIPAGYDNHLDGKFDLEDCTPVPNQEGSWGRVKSLYR